MPSTVPVLTGLTFGGTDLQVESSGHLRIFLQLVDGGPDSLAETRGSDRRMPYYEGQLYGPRRLDRLSILLKGWVSGVGATEADQRSDTAVARQELRQLFDPLVGPLALTITTEDGTAWSIEAYVDSGGLVWDAEPRVPTHHEVMVKLIAIDPPEWTAAGS